MAGCLSMCSFTEKIRNANSVDLDHISVSDLGQYCVPVSLFGLDVLLDKFV